MKKRSFLATLFAGICDFACGDAPEAPSPNVGSASASSGHSIANPVFPKVKLTDLKTDGTDRIYQLTKGEPPWGDYGRILYHGMSQSNLRNRRNGIPLRLERTGPFVPPITFPGIGNIVVTSEMKAAMEQAGFQGVAFDKVHKQLIVELNWHKWDLKAENPAIRPPEGEPEAYLDEDKHSPELAKAMGDLWAVLLKEGANTERIKTGPGILDIEDRYVAGSWKGLDLFYVPANAKFYVSSRAAVWFRDFFAEWSGIMEVPLYQV